MPGVQGHTDLGPLPNAVDNFFSIIARRRIGRIVFKSIVELRATINREFKAENGNPKPFVLTKSAMDNLA